MNDYITPEKIETARKRGACEDALAWLEEAPRTWEEVIEGYADWLLVHATDHLTPERLDRCAERFPWVALQCASDHLTPERLDRCAERLGLVWKQTR